MIDSQPAPATDVADQIIRVWKAVFVDNCCWWFAIVIVVVFTLESVLTTRSSRRRD